VSNLEDNKIFKEAESRNIIANISNSNQEESGNSIAINIELRPNTVKDVDCPLIDKDKVKGLLDKELN